MIKTDDGFILDENLGKIELYVRSDVKLNAGGGLSGLQSIEAWEWGITFGEEVDISEVWRIEFDDNGYVCAGWCVSAAG